MGYGLGRGSGRWSVTMAARLERRREEASDVYVRRDGRKANNSKEDYLHYMLAAEHLESRGT